MPPLTRTTFHPVLVIIGFMLLVAPLQGQTQVSLSGSNEQGPLLVVERSDFDSIDLVLSIDTVLRSTEETKGGSFGLLTLVGYGFSRDVGAPQLPVVREFVEIPLGATVELTLADEVWAEYSLADLGISDPILPAQAPVAKIDGARDAAPFVIDEVLYATDGDVVTESVRFGNEKILRGRRLFDLEIMPVNYNPAAGTVKILLSARIELNLSGADAAATRDTLQKLSSPSFDRLISEAVLNGSAFEASFIGRGSNSGRAVKFLIISAPSFVSNSKLADLIALRTSQGFDVTLVDTNTTGSSATNIKNYIQNQYNTQGIEYFLLVGDTNTIPKWTGSGYGNPDTDLNYACVDGSDYFPDLGRGRLPVRDATDLNNACNKILDMASIGEKKAVFMAGYDNYNISEGTHNYCISNYLNPQGWQSDKLYQVTYGATTQDVKNSFNDGRSIGCFSGHGSTTSWADGPPFSQSNVRSLVNTIYPFVMSFACDTGNYNYTECFTETWVVDDHGGTSCFGSSESSYWDEDDILEKRIFKAYSNLGYNLVGDMIDYGQLELYNYMGSGSFTRMYYEMYNLMGDPTTEILGTGGGSGAPAPDAKINGSDGPLNLYSGQVIDFTVSLDPGEEAGVEYDWWVFAQKDPPQNAPWYWRYPNNWQQSWTPKRGLAYALVPVTDYLVGSSSNLQAGSWEFVFAVDELNNAYEGTYIDTVDVDIQ